MQWLRPAESVQSLSQDETHQNMGKDERDRESDAGDQEGARGRGGSSCPSPVEVDTPQGQVGGHGCWEQRGSWLLDVFPL